MGNLCTSSDCETVVETAPPEVADTRSYSFEASGKYSEYAAAPGMQDKPSAGASPRAKDLMFSFGEDFPVDAAAAASALSEAQEQRKASLRQAAAGKWGSQQSCSMSFRKCPTFIDPCRGLRSGRTVADMSGCVLDTYQVVKKLGEGGFGTVYKIRHKATKKLYALKSIPVGNVSDPESFEKELEIARKLNHPYIIRLHEKFNDAEAYHLVMDFCNGGDLYQHVMNSVCSFAGETHGGLGSKEVGRLIWMILAGIAYMHNYRFAHRDIKPENFLLPDAGPQSGLKLIDFGLGRSFKKGEKMHSKVGTLAYAAPEVMTSEDGYTEKCDMWSIGVLLYVMASAEMPFLGSTDVETLEMVKSGEVKFISKDWLRHPPALKQLVEELLEKDTSQRPSAKEVLQSNVWVAKHAQEASIECCIRPRPPGLRREVLGLAKVPIFKPCLNG